MIFIHVPDIKRFQNMDSVISWLNDFCGGLNEVCNKRSDKQGLVRR